MKFPNWWTKFWLNPWMGVCVIVSFLAAGAWITSWSWYAESHNSTGLWTVIASLMTILAIGLMIRVANTSRGGDS